MGNNYYNVYKFVVSMVVNEEKPCPRHKEEELLCSVVLIAPPHKEKHGDILEIRTCDLSILSL